MHSFFHQTGNWLLNTAWGIKYSGYVKIVGSSVRHISMWGTLVTDREYIFSGSLAAGEEYLTNYNKRREINKSTLSWVSLKNCHSIEVRKVTMSTLRFWFKDNSRRNSLNDTAGTYQTYLYLCLDLYDLDTSFLDKPFTISWFET